MKKWIALSLSLLLGLSLLSGCIGSGEKPPELAPSSTVADTASPAPGGGVEPIVLKLSHDNTETSPLQAGAERFAELVKERTNGRYEIEIYPNGSLTTAANSIEDCQMGTLDLAEVNISILASVVPEYEVFNLPFLIQDNDHADEVFLGESEDYWLSLLDQAGLKGLTIFETGWRDVSNSVREVHAAEDVKGLRIRVMENKMMIEAWKALGADPVAMSWSDMYTAMQQGVIDAQDNPAGISISNNINEVQKYYSPINYIYSVIPIIMSPAAWNALSPEDQEIFRACADEAAVYQREVNREITDSALEEMEKRDMAVTRDVDRDSFMAVLAPMLEEYRDQYKEQMELIESCR